MKFKYLKLSLSCTTKKSSRTSKLNLFAQIISKLDLSVCAAVAVGLRGMLFVLPICRSYAAFDIKQSNIKHPESSIQQSSFK